MNPYLKEIADRLPKSQVHAATGLGLSLSPDLDLEGWSRLISTLAKTAGRASGSRDTLTAWLGDLLAYGDGRYRGQIKEYAQAAGLEPNTLRIAKLVCSRIPMLSRINTLSWSHHCEIGKAFRELPEIERWLKIAVKEGCSKAQLRKMIRSHLAGESGSHGSISDRERAPFLLLRDLRAVARFVSHHSQAWASWSPAACQQALSEMEPIAGFLADLKSRSCGNRSPAVRDAV